MFCLLCFVGAPPSLSGLHWDDVDLNVRIHVKPLFRERVMRGGSTVAASAVQRLWN